VPLSLAQGGERRVVCKVWDQADERSPDELRTLAHQLAQSADVVAFLACAGVERTHLIFARGSEGGEPDLAALLREACAQLGGKGGGRPHLAQGSAPATDAARVKAVLADLLSPLGITIS
jgi:alanyl-tRNA synthetase